MLHVRPEVGTLEILISDPAKTQDDEVLGVDDRFDGPVAALGDFDFPGDLRMGTQVGESFRDSIFHGG